jgi:spore coat polysaccharide biosynthesis protein SpsF
VGVAKDRTRMTSDVIAIVQARMESKRLPGKVMMNLAGEPVIHHVVSRVLRSQSVADLIVATTTRPADDAIENWCKNNAIKIFRGSEHDVLDRFFQAAVNSPAQKILRITADCPALDSEIIANVVRVAESEDWDYFGVGGAFPNGVDCTVIDRKALTIAWKESTLKSDREHVGPFIERHPNRFRIGAYQPFSNHFKYRWTLDESADFQLLTHLFDHLGAKDSYFGAWEIIEFLDSHPKVFELNQHIQRNEGYKKSVQED